MILRLLRFAPLVLAAAVVACAGCKTNAPMVENHTLTFQKKLQAVQHWKVLSSELVARLEQNGQFSGRSVYVDMLGEDTEFSQAFGKLLVAALSERGFKIVSVESAAEVKLLVGNQVIFHGRRYGSGFNATSAVGALALGVRNAVAGDNSGSPGQTRGELLVTSWVHHRNRVLYCDNQIAYITTKDAPLYLSGTNWEQFSQLEASRSGFKHWLASSLSDDNRW